MHSGRTLAVVVAHPDDDAFALSGTVAMRATDPAFCFVLVHATDGAAGDIAAGFPATRETLGAIRRVEDERAWRALGRVPDRHEWLDYADGALDRVPLAELTEKIAAILDQERPDVVATFGPDGITGHPDHIQIGAATDAAFLRLAHDGGPGFRRLVHGALPRSVFERWNISRIRTGLPPWDPTATYQLRGVPDESIHITIDNSSVANRIVAGLREHRSQQHILSEFGWSDDAQARAASREHLVIAWPPPEPGRPLLTDIFESIG